MDLKLHSFLANERLSAARRLFDELEIRFGKELPGDPNIDEIAVAAELRAGLRHVVRETASKAADIVRDRDLSDQGKDKRLADLSRDMAQRVANLRKIADTKLAASLESLRKELEKPLADPHQGDAVAAIRLMEIRTRLAGLNDTDRLSALWAAVERGDCETLAAFGTAPRSFPLAPVETIGKALNVYWQKQRPDLVEQIDRIEAATGILACDFRIMTDALRSLGGGSGDGSTGDDVEQPANVPSAGGTE